MALAVVEEQAQATAGETRALEEAFERFVEQTDQLRAAYLELKQRAERIDLELSAANRQLQQKVRELDEVSTFQRSILESIPTAVVVTDLDGVINTFNPAAERMWRVCRADALGTHFTDVMGADGALLATVLAGQARSESLRREVGGDDARTISSTASLVDDSNGRPIGAIQVDQDITQLCSLQSRLYQQEKLADLGKMAAGLAHEIRKPLNGIKGFASILERHADRDARQQRYIGHIMGAADRLNSMLGRMLDFARPDDVRPRSCDLAAEAEQVAEFVRAEDPAGRVAVVADLPDGLPSVTADPDKLKQVLLNLVKNGVEAIEGAGRVTVGAQCVDDGQAVRVSVTNTGAGIAPEDVGHVLEPFHTSKQGGTGLGLAIVARILQLHGTELEVDSRPGEGTAMAFVLPVAPSAEEP